MSTVQRATRPVNSAATTSPASPASTIAAVAWHTLLKTAGTEAIRDDLTANSDHVVNLTIAGDVDGEAFHQQLQAVLSVGTDTTRASSATPDQARLIGAILAKLNEATREAILRDLPEQFEAAGCELPNVPASIEEKTASMLKRLRAKKTINVRGSVTVKYATAGPDGGEAEFAGAGC